MSDRAFRIGQIVPSSNITMETEIPAMLRARGLILPDRFTFHSSRMRMKKVTKEELVAMDDESKRCAAELADAQVDVIGYACLVAIMSRGIGYHRQSRDTLTEVVQEISPKTRVVNSAGALVDGLNVIGARKISVITPYMRPLTGLVCDYIENEGIRVVDRVSLEISDNISVGEREPLAVLDQLDRIETRDVDAVVLSACVQMPSLPAIEIAQQRIGKPVVSAATCTVFAMLKELNLEPRVPDAGALLDGTYG
ncbi:maleate cis-trans isomerase family protein [Limibacillus halophilus]|uniref:Maleate isomerase n=1 Tax=Limibacillus halophilus TaxID=1579333 RepID=A0A839T1G6_9PROT|nr:Asp/Glu racemase [Limibacillus halophilus]MBB3066983.1 maleate isomerase [Limibacillus halophilus]